ncbi:MAG: hypothetical protein KAH18_06175 [Psychromonas sp.]|nr:hypothetical protein [Psychromonas sp.]
MVNINVALPSATVAHFNLGSEALQRENALRPTIPKTEPISHYAKFKENNQQPTLLRDQHIIFQDENNEKQKGEDKNKSTENKRSIFFSKRGELAEMVKTPKMPSGVDDFKIVIAAIQMRYQNSVTPFPTPSFQFTI